MKDILSVLEAKANMQPGGQSIVDRLLAAKNTIAGQALAKTVCKATTEEMIGPKRKHLDFLIQATNEMNVSIPEVADLLIERAQNSSWVVCLKALITIHHLMCYGNERFQAYMASHNHHLQSAVWLDQGGMPGGGDMTSYIRRYATYLNEKRDAYKLMGYDFCKIKRGKDDGVLRTMSTEKLLKTLPILLKQLDAALLFDVTSNELMNPVVNSCFYLLIKDLIRLYATFNDGMINLLEKYFDMNKKQCREGLEIYKKFLDRTDKVSHFLKTAETSGIEHNEIPDLSRAPSSLLEALENHLAQIEGKKVSNQSTVSKHQTEEDVRRFSRDYIINDNNDDAQKILEEEAKALAQFNKKKEATSPPATTTKNSKSDASASFTDDLLSLATPTSSHIAPSIIPTTTTGQVSEIVVPKPNFFDDILQPTSGSNSISTSKSNISNLPVVNKPLQSGDLNSSLNHLLEHLDMKDHSKVGKDHQWSNIENKNQQKIGIGATTTMLNTPGTTWPLNGPFTMNLPTGNLWQAAPMMPSNNPFSLPQGTSSNLNATAFRPSNPFLGQTTFNNNSLNSKQINDPFGSL